jgi:hypothetical protein
VASTTIQALPYPLLTDAGNAPSWIQQLAQAVEVKLNMIFATTAARDAALTAPTAGMEVFITGTLEKQRRVGTAWVVVGGKNAPFAEAAGTVAYALNGVSNVNVAITFPTGRFTVAPVVMASQQSAGGGTVALTVRPFNILTTGCTINMGHNAGTVVTVTGETLAWHAVQMTSSAAGG